MTKDILTSPILNGTPTGSGVATFIEKMGSASAVAYSTAAASYSDVDATRLTYSTVIPVGWKAVVDFSGNAIITTPPGYVVLVDSGTRITGALINSATYTPFNIKKIVTGDGKTHTFKAQFRSDGGGTLSILNTSEFTSILTIALIPAN